MLYLSLEYTEWPWVALVCMQMVVLMLVEIAPCQKIYAKISRPTLLIKHSHCKRCLILCVCNY